jgi:hypothetical protein
VCWRVGELEGLLEHAHQGIEVSLIIAVNVAAESCGLLAVENHQLGHSLGITNCLLVVGDGLLGLGDRGVLIAEDVRPKPPINDFLVRFQFGLGIGAEAENRAPTIIGFFLEEIYYFLYT